MLAHLIKRTAYAFSSRSGRYQRGRGSTGTEMIAVVRLYGRGCSGYSIFTVINSDGCGGTVMRMGTNNDTLFLLSNNFLLARGAALCAICSLLDTPSRMDCGKRGMMRYR